MATQRSGRVLVTPRSLQPKGGEHHPSVKRLVQAGLEVVYPTGRGPFAAPAMRELIRDVDAAIVGVDVVDRTVLEAAQALKVVARFGVACDRVDLQAATERGIVVTNTPGANAVAVAEYTVGLMIGVMRHVAVHHARVTQGDWTVLQGRELAGKQLGLIGLGRIGLEVAKRCRAFGMQVGYFDLARRPESVEREWQLQYMSFDALLQWADIVSLHIPYVPGAGPLLGANEFRKMKPGAVLVNTARGELVDETALCDALRSGQLGGAALDVFSKEPLPPEHPLLRCPNVLLSPHAASHTAEAAYRMAEEAVQSVLDVLAGLTPEHVVNTEVLSRLQGHGVEAATRT